MARSPIIAAVSSLDAAGRTLTYTSPLYQRDFDAFRRCRRGGCLEGIGVECGHVFDASLAADHDHGLRATGHREFLELAGSSLRKTLFSELPHRVSRCFELLLLFGRNTGVTLERLPACGNGVFPKPRAHRYLTVEPGAYGERQDYKSNS